MSPREIAHSAAIGRLIASRLDIAAGAPSSPWRFPEAVRVCRDTWGMDEAVAMALDCASAPVIRTTNTTRMATEWVASLKFERPDR